MDVWCNWCGAAAKVPRAAAGQELGCTACRRVFVVPAEVDPAELAEEEILGILGPGGGRPVRVTEDEVLRILARDRGRLGSLAPRAEAMPDVPRRRRMWLSLVDGSRLTTRAG